MGKRKSTYRQNAHSENIEELISLFHIATIKRMVFLSVLLVSLFCGKFAAGQSDGLKIYNIQEPPDLLLYCNTPIVATPKARVEGRDLNQPNDGIKISIANYVKGEDYLYYDGITTPMPAWNNNKGELIITGNRSAKEYSEIIAKVYYQNQAQIPTPGERQIVVTLSDADFLPTTQHFYKYISKPGISWDNAKYEASELTYNGLRGYLVTIITKEENDFIWAKTQGVGWIGASDAESEGVWKWVTGPEAGTTFWRYGSTVSGMYSNWNSGEPNNVGTNGEHYAHINYGVGIPGAWNDLPIAGGSGEYYPRGYIVEFGGLDGDPEIQLYATQIIHITKTPYYGTDSLDFCRGGTPLKLNKVKDSQNYTYEWFFDDILLSNTDATIEVLPDKSTIYKAIAQSVVNESCRDTAYIARVFLRELPVSELLDTTHLCLGNNVPLNAGNHSSYKWSTGSTNQTIMPTAEGEYWVTIQNKYKCATTDTTTALFNKRPEIVFDPADTLVCGALEQTFRFSYISEDECTTLLKPQTIGAKVENADTQSPTIVVERLGRYFFNLEITNQNQCVFDTLIAFSFNRKPEAKFNIDSTSCYGYNIQVKYEGEWNSKTTYFQWYSYDTVYAEGYDLVELTIPLGADKFNASSSMKRSVGLLVEENGCSDFKKVDVKVKPQFELWAVTDTGCEPFHAYLSSKTLHSAVAWHWDFGDGDTNSQQYTNHIFRNETNEPVNYNVLLQVTAANGCENMGILPGGITVNPKPTANFGFSSEIVYLTDPYVEFYNESENATSFQWEFGDGSKSSDSIPQHKYPDLGTYKVSLMAYNSWGCIDTVSHNILVVFDKIFAPNAFSPNSGNEVDRIFRLGAYGVSDDNYQLRIYNRWGEMIFESRSPEIGWDGKLKNGSFAQSGTYTWILQYRNSHNQSRKQQGSVMLLY